MTQVQQQQQPHVCPHRWQARSFSRTRLRPPGPLSKSTPSTRSSKSATPTAGTHPPRSEEPDPRPRGLLSLASGDNVKVEKAERTHYLDWTDPDKNGRPKRKPWRLLASPQEAA